MKETVQAFARAVFFCAVGVGSLLVPHGVDAQPASPFVPSPSPPSALPDTPQQEPDGDESGDRAVGADEEAAAAEHCVLREDGSFRCHGLDGHALSQSFAGETVEFRDALLRSPWGTFEAEYLAVSADRIRMTNGTVGSAVFASAEIIDVATEHARCSRDGAPCPTVSPQRGGLTEAALVARPGALSGRVESLVPVGDAALVVAMEGGDAGVGGTVALQPRSTASPVRLDALWDGEQLSWLMSGATIARGNGAWLRLDLDRGAAGGRRLFAGDGLDSGRQTSSVTVGAGDEHIQVSVTARDLAGDTDSPSRQRLEADAALRAVDGPLSASFRTAGDFSVDGERRPAVGVASEATGALALGRRGLAWIPGARLSLTNWSTPGERAEAPSVAQQLDAALDMELSAQRRGVSVRAWGQLVGSPIIRDDRRELQFAGPWRVDEGLFSSSYQLSYTMRRPWGFARWQTTARWSDRVDGAVGAQFLATGQVLQAGAQSIWRDDDGTPARVSAWLGAQSAVLGIRISAIGESGDRAIRPPTFGRLPLRRLDDASSRGLGVAQEVWIHLRDVRVEAQVIARSTRADDVSGWGGVRWHRDSSLWGLRADLGRQPTGFAGTVALSLGRSPVFGPFARRWYAPGT